MSEFLSLIPPAQAFEKWVSEIEVRPLPEQMSTENASGRVLWEDLKAPHALPSFTRSTVDGYAVRAADTHGASESLPAYLALIGEVGMGARPDFSLGGGDCALIHTGGMLPEGADAVVMVEHSQAASDIEVEIMRAAAGGENVIFVGEDLEAGQVAITRGTRLRPAEIGGLMAFGITQVQVARQPVVAVLSSGDEVVPPESNPGPGQVRDINSYTLQALIRRAGGSPVLSGIIPDDPAAFQESAEQALAASDILLFTAGSSVSVRDLTARTIDALGAPGVLVHGVSIRPGKPTILGVCRGKPVIGLPGNPVSALVIAGIFVVPMVERLLGLQNPGPPDSVEALLEVNLPSQAGREDWVPVRLEPGESGYRAVPVFGKSNLIFTLVGADGLIRIPPQANGLPAGSRVRVITGLL